MFKRSCRTQAKVGAPKTSENFIECNRKRTNYHSKSVLTSTTKFVSTSGLRLKKISCYLSNKPGTIKAKVKIHEISTDKSRGKMISCVKTSLKPHYYVDVKLPAPVLVEPGAMYEIYVELKSTSTPCTYKRSTQNKGGTTIEFSDKNDYLFVSGLQFVEYKK